MLNSYHTWTEIFIPNVGMLKIGTVPGRRGREAELKIDDRSCIQFKNINEGSFKKRKIAEFSLKSHSTPLAIFYSYLLKIITSHIKVKAMKQGLYLHFPSKGLLSPYFKIAQPEPHSFKLMIYVRTWLHILILSFNTWYKNSLVNRLYMELEHLLCDLFACVF